jgi:hypothetical protein
MAKNITTTGKTDMFPNYDKSNIFPKNEVVPK